MVVALGILFFVGIVAMLTCGFVLLLHIWGQKLSFWTRVFLAALLGPGWLFAMPMILQLIDGGIDMMEIGLGMGAIGAGLCLVIGFPVALFTTRKVDRPAPPDASVFE